MSRTRGDLSYHDVAGSTHGLMICAACRKPITAGEYRVRDTDDRYVTHHRACTASDPQWAARDNHARLLEAEQADLLAAAIAFRERWKISDLDDLIGWMRESQAPDHRDDGEPE